MQRELDPLLRALVRDVSRRGDGTVRFCPQHDQKSFETSAAREDLVKTLVDGRLLVSDGANIRVAQQALLRRWNRASEILERLADAELRQARLRALLATAAAVLFLLFGFIAYREAGRAEQQRAEANKQQNEADNQRSEAENQRNQALLRESRFLSRLAESETENNDFGAAALLALEALPDRQSDNVVRKTRPLLPRAELILNSALQGNQERLLLKGHADCQKRGLQSRRRAPPDRL